MESEEPQTQSLAEEQSATKFADVTVISPLGKSIHLPPIPLGALVSSIKQALTELAETCSFSAYQLVWDGDEPITLNDYVEIVAYPFLENGCTLKMVLDNYDMRKVRTHLKRLRDLLVFPPVEMLPSTQQKAVRQAQAQAQSTTAEKEEETALAPSGNGAAPEKLEEMEESLMWARLLQERAETKKRLHDAIPETENMEISVSLASVFDVCLHKLVEAPEIDPTPVKCLHGISHSVWNPPPPNRTMHGDIMYLEVQTLEEGIIHITCTGSGFYVNHTSHDEFDPRPAANAHFSHELLYTLLSASPSFLRAWNRAVRKATDSFQLMENPLLNISYNLKAGRVPAVFLKSPWLLPKNYGTHAQHITDASRAESAYMDTYGIDEGAIREWNDELQSLLQLKPSTRQEELMKLRFIYKTYVEFTQACEAAAVAIIDGQITPMNPQDNERSHVYLYNNIFFSKASDVADGIKQFKGDDAARKSLGYDHSNQRLVHMFGIENLHLVMTTIVDYKGQRIVGQSILPGVFSQGKQAARLMYGSLEASAPLKCKAQFHECMKALGKHLGIAERQVSVNALARGDTAASTQPKVSYEATGVDPSRHGMLAAEQAAGHTLAVDDEGDVPAVDDKIPFVGPLECKGLQGSDGRFYLLEATRLAPLDANYLTLAQGGTGVFQDEELARLDLCMLPLYSLRPNLVARWRSAKLNVFRRQKLVELGYEDVEEEEEGQAGDGEQKEEQKSAAQSETPAKEAAQSEDEQAQQKALAEAERQARQQRILEQLASLEQEYLATLALNANVFTPFNTLQSEEEKRQDEELARDVSIFLSRDTLMALDNDIRARLVAPIDGQHLTQLLHSRGVNLRYLGKLATMVQAEEKEDAELSSRDIERHYKMPSYWLELLETEIFARCCKHVFGKLLNEHLADGASVVDVVCVFLNQLFRNAQAVDSTTNGSSPRAHAAAKPSTKSSSKRATKKAKKSVIIAQLASMTSLVVPEPPVPVMDDVVPRIMQEIETRFCYLPTLFGPTAITEQRVRLSRLSVLRRICQQCGIQIAAQMYDFNSKAPFSKQDIIGIVPIVKTSAPLHPHPEAREYLDTVFEAVKEMDLRTAFLTAQQTLSEMQEVCGVYHEDVMDCMEAMSSVLSQAGDMEAATEMLYKALAAQIQMNGVDSYQTIVAHERLAVMLHSNQKTDVALRHLIAALFLCQMCVGIQHPAVAQGYMKMAVMYQDVAHNDMALRCTQHILLHFNNIDHASMIAVYHTTGEMLSLRGQFREAVTVERQAYVISKALFGQDNPRTTAMYAQLQKYTKAAVQQAQLMKTREQEAAAHLVAAVEAEVLTQTEPAPTPSADGLPAKKKKEKKNKNK